MPKPPISGRPFLRVALAAAALVAALALPGCDAAGPDGVADVAAAGTVTNTHGRPVVGATVSFDALDEGATAYASATTDEEGRFSTEVPPGTYTFVAAAEGYHSVGRTLTIGMNGNDAVAQTLTGAGSLVAQAVSALTGEGAPGIELRCVRRRTDGSFPHPTLTYDFSVLSDEEGSLQVAGAPAGSLRCRTEGPDLPVRLFDIVVRRDGPTTLPPLVITPPSPEGALRIVLTWGQSPTDLDAHLTGPDGGGGRFHIYYGNRYFLPSLLDVDDTDSFGPETITVFPPAEGLFRYSVHNWSNQGPSGSDGIAASPARVEVYDHLGLLCTYLAPPASQAGNTWRVFEVEAREVGDAVDLDAPCARGELDLPGLGYVTASETNDLGAFLTTPPPKPSGS